MIAARVDLNGTMIGKDLIVINNVILLVLLSLENNSFLACIL